MARSFGLALLVAVAAFPTASAGTADDPEVPDSPTDASNPAFARCGELLAAWIEDGPTTLTFRFQLASFDSASCREVVYEFQFFYKEYFYDAYAIMPADLAPFFGVYRADPQDYSNTKDPRETTGFFDIGSPTNIGVEFPKDFLEEDLNLSVAAAAVLDEFYVFIIDGLSPTAYSDGFESTWLMDEASGARSFALPEANETMDEGREEPTDTAPSTPTGDAAASDGSGGIPGPEGALILLAFGATLFLLRRPRA